jgi:GlcNAc-P-P-Und epimerase
MKVLVTGSAGFLGRALAVELSSAGHDVVGVDRVSSPGADGGVRMHSADICDATRILEIFAAEQPELVVHCAARIDIAPHSRIVDYAANVEGVAAVIRAVASTPSVRRAIWTSSQLVSRIGRIPRHDLDYDPDSTYGDSKVITERLVRTLAGGGKEWTIIRPTTLWGPGMSDHYLTLLRYIESGRYVHIGYAPCLKSFAYIRNACFQIRALLLAPAAAVHQKTFYIADYDPVALHLWCNALAAALGRAPPRTIPVLAATGAAWVGDWLNATVAPGFKLTTFRLRNITTPYVFDMRSLAAVVGALPVKLPEAVGETVAWYRERTA